MPPSTTQTPVILLAGGASMRTGALGPKGMIAVSGRPFIAWQVRALLARGLAPVVVTGVHHDLYAGALAADALRIARNPEPERGPFSSLRVGLGALREARPAALAGGRPGHDEHSAGLFVLPLDVPAPEAAVFALLAGRGAGAALPTFEGRGGHPVWLSQAIAQRLLSVPEGPEARLDRQLARLRDEGLLRRVPVRDPGIHANLNTPGAWEAYLALHASQAK